jgi:hypothetical protein
MCLLAEPAFNLAFSESVEFDEFDPIFTEEHVESDEAPFLFKLGFTTDDWKFYNGLQMDNYVGFIKSDHQTINGVLTNANLVVTPITGSISDSIHISDEYLNSVFEEYEVIEKPRRGRFIKVKFNGKYMYMYQYIVQCINENVEYTITITCGDLDKLHELRNEVHLVRNERNLNDKELVLKFN